MITKFTLNDDVLPVKWFTDLHNCQLFSKELSKRLLSTGEDFSPPKPVHDDIPEMLRVFWNRFENVVSLS